LSADAWRESYSVFASQCRFRTSTRYVTRVTIPPTGTKLTPNEDVLGAVSPGHFSERTSSRVEVSCLKLFELSTAYVRDRVQQIAPMLLRHMHPLRINNDSGYKRHRFFPRTALVEVADLRS
jgi:hypothetical protein